MSNNIKEEKQCPNYFQPGRCMSDKKNASATCSESYLYDYENCPYQDKDGR